MSSKTHYLQQHFWDNNAKLPFFRLFDNPKASDIVLISCFNKRLNNFKVLKNKKWVYYTGERFLTEANSNIIIGFLPTNRKLLDYGLSDEGKWVKENPGLVINEVNLAKSKYEYNMATKTKSINDLIQPIIDNKVFYIQLRDQERFQIQLYTAKNNITKLTKELIAEIRLYKTLEDNWIAQYNKFKGLNTDKLLKTKPKFACFIVSNPQCWQRNKIFDMLRIMCSKKVDSMGKWKRNVDIIIPDREREQEDYYKLIGQYRFMITCENHSLAWYNTEKIYNAFAAGTVPIYWGDPLITDVYNPACFVHIPTFNDNKHQLKAIMSGCERVNEIEKALSGNNTEPYLSFFKEQLMTNVKAEDARVQESLNQIYTIFNTLNN